MNDINVVKISKLSDKSKDILKFIILSILQILFIVIEIYIIYSFIYPDSIPILEIREIVISLRADFSVIVWLILAMLIISFHIIVIFLISLSWKISLFDEDEIEEID
jgi:hypothetical protein